MVVEINSIQWNIIFTNNVENLKRPDGSITLGVTDIPCRTIFIWAGLTGRMLRKVVIHELSHAFVFSHEYELSIDEEEFLCSFIDTYAEDIITKADSLLKGGLSIIRKFS